MQAEESLSVFNQYGLPGIVIFALFAIIWQFIKELKNISESNNNKIETILKHHNERIDEIYEQHRDEREKWLEAYQENTEVLRAFLEKLGRVQ